MHNGRSDEAVTGEPGTLAAAGRTITGNRASGPGGDGRQEGDVIRGLRSGLIFSLAIWAVLLTVGTLVFA
jgi:hypothetical protein